MQRRCTNRRKVKQCNYISFFVNSKSVSQSFTHAKNFCRWRFAARRIRKCRSPPESQTQTLNEQRKQKNLQQNFGFCQATTTLGNECACLAKKLHPVVDEAAPGKDHCLVDNCHVRRLKFSNHLLNVLQLPTHFSNHLLNQRTFNSNGCVQCVLFVILNGCIDKQNYGVTFAAKALPSSHQQKRYQPDQPH